MPLLSEGGGGLVLGSLSLVAAEPKPYISAAQRDTFAKFAGGHGRSKRLIPNTGNRATVRLAELLVVAQARALFQTMQRCCSARLVCLA